MPAARMCKATIMATQDMMQEIVETLHGMGAVEITDAVRSIEEKTLYGEDIDPVRPHAEDIRQTRLELAKTDFIIGLLDEHDDSKTGFLGSFIREKAHATYDEFVTVKRRVELERLYRDLEKLDVELRKLDARSEELKEKLADLLPWEALELALPELETMKSSAFRAYVLDVERFPDWVEDVEKNCAFNFWELVSKRDGKARIAALVHREELESFSDIAELHNAEPYAIDIEAETVALEIDSIRRELEYAEVRRRRIVETIRSYRHLKHELFICLKLQLPLLRYEKIFQRCCYGGLLRSKDRFTGHGSTEQKRRYSKEKVESRKPKYSKNIILHALRFWVLCKKSFRHYLFIQVLFYVTNH